MQTHRASTIGIAVMMACSLFAREKNGLAEKDTFQAHRHITRATSYGVGTTNVYDTYLSPQEYKGMEFRLARESMRMTTLFDGNVSLQSLFQVNFSYTGNRADNNHAVSSLASWNYGLHYQFRLTENFKLLAGALLDINGGFIYSMRNSNNPASARAFVNLDASGMAIWRLKIRQRYPLTLRYQLNVPFVGAMFSPHYGQSYYEIFSVQNTKGIIHFTSIHNQPSLRHLLSVDFPIGALLMRLSYVGDFQQSKVNRIETHAYSHALMVGFVKELYRIRPKDKPLLPASMRAY